MGKKCKCCKSADEGAEDYSVIKEIEVVFVTEGSSSEDSTEFKKSKKKSKRSKLIKPRIRARLDTNEFDQFMGVVWKSFSEEKRMSFTYLDSLWFPMYREDSTKPKVLKWIKKKSIFSKDYVFVPVCCWGQWSLLIFVHFDDSFDSETRTPCILLLDSLEKAEPKRLEPEIRK